MLFAAVSCIIGMVIAGGLLSPAGDQNQMRANAGITFICKSASDWCCIQHMVLWIAD